MFGIGVCCSRNCMALRGQMRCPPKRLFALVSEQISGSMHWPSFLTCQRGALWLTGHGLRVPGGCRPCNPRKARKGWVDVSELTRNRVQRYAKMAGERERLPQLMHGIYRLCSISWAFAKTLFSQGETVFLVSFGQEDIGIDDRRLCETWIVECCNWTHGKDARRISHTRDLADPICSLIPQLLGRLVYVPCRGNQMDPNGLMVD